MSVAEFDDETAGARFDEAVAYIKDHTDDMTLKDAIKASGIAFGKSVAEEGEGQLDEIDVDADLDEDRERELEEALVGREEGSLVQIGTGQVAAHTGSGPVPTTFAVAVVTFTVMLAMFIILCHIAYYLFMVALLVSLGIIAYNGLAYLANER